MLRQGAKRTVGKPGGPHPEGFVRPGTMVLPGDGGYEFHELFLGQPPQQAGP